jgi:hypothetical protein
VGAVFEEATEEFECPLCGEPMPSEVGYYTRCSNAACPVEEFDEQTEWDA